MKAVTWQGKEDVRVERVPDPSILEPTDAIIKVTSTAICGSDLHLYSKLAPVMKQGDILGHEPMGIVQEVGKDVEYIKKGDRVVVPFNIACGSCYYCLRGLQSQCEITQNDLVQKGGSLFGYTHLYGGVPGGQAEYLRVPQAHYGPIKVPEGPDDVRFLFLSDVLPTGWQAVEYARVPKAGLLGVWGLGPIGQMCCRIGAMTADWVLGIDWVPERLEMARQNGINTLDMRKADDVPETVKDITGGRGLDSAIDAVGMESEGSLADSILASTRMVPDKLRALKDCLGSLRRGGTLSISGVYTGWYPMFPLGDLFDKQITIAMGQANVKRWVDDLMPLIYPEDRLGVESLATHFMAIDQAPGAYDMFQKKSDGAIKIVLEPGRAA